MYSTSATLILEDSLEKFFEVLIFITAKEILKAVDTGQLELLKIFLKTREDKNPVVYISNSGSRFTVLHNAAYEGQLGIIRWYREALNFSNINPKDSEGVTPLFWQWKEENKMLWIISLTLVMVKTLQVRQLDITNDFHTK